jgi:hypothetical protein
MTGVSDSLILPESYNNSVVSGCSLEEIGGNCMCKLELE